MLENLEYVREKYQKQISYVLGIIIPILYAVFIIAPDILPFEAATGLSLSIVFVYLALILSKVENSESVEILKDYLEAASKIQEYVAKNNVKQAKILALVGRATVKTMVEQLVKKGADVTVLIQHPEWCIKDHEHDLNAFISDFKKSSASNKQSGIKVILYKNMPPFRATIIDDEIISIGLLSYPDNKKQGLNFKDAPHLYLESTSSEFIRFKTFAEKAIEELIDGSESITLEDYINSIP